MTAARIGARGGFPAPRRRARIVGLTVAANFAGALLTYLYFSEIDKLALQGPTLMGAREAHWFVLGFVALSAAGFLVRRRWMRPLCLLAGAAPAGAAGDVARRRALLMPAFSASLSWVCWVSAGVLFGLVYPLLAGTFQAGDSLRVGFGIVFVGGSFVAAISFLGVELLWRGELDQLFPGGELSATPVPRLGVRTRMLVALVLVGVLPLAVLAASALTRAQALLQADAATAASIVHNLIGVVVVITVGGLLASLGLATLVAASIAGPLRQVQLAMRQVARGALDVRCAVRSVDELGALAEGFNTMVEGLRERERIRETFGKYVGREVRDEILTGAAAAGVQREVTILFADLRDFTPWVESRPAAEVVADLNAYFSEMEAAIRAHGGLVLQFIGDEIEAVFGAPADNPRHADAALAAARAMGERLVAWNAAQRAAGRHELRHGIGIHSGTVIAGNIGSGERLAYALVGDAVNVASRVQDLNKELGTTVLISVATVQRLSSGAQLEPRSAMPMKGHAAGVAVYALE